MNVYIYRLFFMPIPSHNSGNTPLHHIYVIIRVTQCGNSELPNLSLAGNIEHSVV